MEEKVGLLASKREAHRPSPAMQQALSEVREAISIGIFPTLISQGTSGSYFCYNRQREVVGVFKPKNEEPYGDFNPKWGKWLQRTVCRCCFGRSCLLNNVGYVSEAAASAVSRRFQFSIVPETTVVRLSSPTFNYSYLRRKLDKKLHQYFELPPKIGSFQLFVRNAQDASVLCNGTKPLGPRAEAELRRRFERLVLLDYVIRNTDRGMDNWLVRFGDRAADSRHSTPAGSLANGSDALSSDGAAESVEVYGIDNGLAFPFKHPDNWRSYPYGWADLPMARVPFSTDTSEDVLPKIQSADFVSSLITDLRQIMALDSHFSETNFHKQMAVMQGQLYNLEQCLLQGGSPVDLVNMTPLVVEAGPRRNFLRRLMTVRPWFRFC
jgi:phosphatidylinositol 4-kinase type 2